MKAVTLIILFLAVAAPAQSGRQKPTPTPTPRAIIGPSVWGLPPLPTPSASPVKAPAKAEPDEVIRVSSVLVPIPLTVLEPSGKPAPALRLEDFELTINGGRATITDLIRSESPIRLGMLFDNSSSVSIAREFEKNAAVRFFRRVVRPDRDLAALFSVADYTRLEQPLTSDVPRLVSAIESFPEPRGATALLDGVIEVADYLKSTNGRRIVVIVSDGEDTYSDLKTTLEGVVKVLQISDCQVYVVKTKDYENFKRTGIRGGNANTRTLSADHRMSELAAQTGGKVYSPIDDQELSAAFAQIAAELAEQYVLSYYPEDETAVMGSFQSVAVAVKGKPNYTVRTRKGYYVGKR